MHYFRNPHGRNGCNTEKTWTLGEWLDAFKIEETEGMTRAWLEVEYAWANGGPFLLG